MKIAGKNTDKQWFALKARLQSKPSQDLWDSAYRSFYRERIDTRYLRPIASIPDTQNGEGFAIATLFCSLIEFLESCERGHNFQPVLKAQLQPNEYNQETASRYFKDFLKKREPFKTLIPLALVNSFYKDVRCGLLHEARTKGTWLISSAASSGVLISQSASQITLFRRQLAPALETYFVDYRNRLLNDPITQQAFIRKFDHLCIPYPKDFNAAQPGGVLRVETTRAPAKFTGRHAMASLDIYCQRLNLRP
jgi:hypothetical protein